jgi:NhaA family Na+:H+ antiporter
MLAAIAALLWANSSWRTAYFDLWDIRIGFEGRFGFQRNLHFWINDGLMTVFFFVVGLEIRREIHSGELSEFRRAAFPFAAALGGMVVPALIFFGLNSGRPSVSGWAVPMATDIAFALGTLALLGKRVPPALRILLLALAVIDDVGAIAVIAFFYSTGFTALGLAGIGLGIIATFAMRTRGVSSPFAYLLPGFAVWLGAYKAGIHPTVAGVVMGLMTPVAPLGATRGEAVSPVEKLEHSLHPWVAFGVMPLFAFANAGVPIGQVSLTGDAKWVFLGVMLGLMIGKPLGIVAISSFSTYVGASVLQGGLRWSHIALVGMVGGIGFTMALFIAQLAFPSGPLLEAAKLAILCGSALAGLVSLITGYRFLATNPSAIFQDQRP